jgi:hypothetical protein
MNMKNLNFCGFDKIIFKVRTGEKSSLFGG